VEKALFEMNVQLSNVISDIVGETGLRITEAIIAGQRDPMQLAALCSTRIKASRETVAKSLHGNWEEALLFALKAALETYRFIQTKIQECDCCIQQHLAQFESRAESDQFAAGFKSSTPPSVRSRFDKDPEHQRAISPDYYFRGRPGYEPMED